ncbi:MAG: DUF3604 domain-containing protein, partial [Sphingomonadaceae bacterium]
MRSLGGMISGISGLALASLLAGCAAVSEGEADSAAVQTKPASVAAASGNPDELLWGDIHLHTEYSMDANTFGVRLTPEDAYRFAQGEKVTASNGMTAQLETPLDFLMVADHSDNLGSFNELRKGNPRLLANPVLAEWLRILGLPTRAERMVIEGRQTNQDNPAELDDDATRASYWAKNVEAAERAYKPGRFTSLIGFEFTAQNVGQNLHRVVMFRDGAELAGSTLPLSASTTDDPMDLWAYMERYEARTGGRVLAVAHNGNISNGAMFPLDTNEFGAPMTAEYARKRARWEPA